ncbi:aminotransferase class III-fold pyridoxal phosphate-dependent enzyme [Streptomyces sp. NPDC047706]|uniref:aminotransferase class III-fold pyridoxal phosphate-dependent enzyme n=1 Tax=Streptomyces sp. NPDC047706 TaxID=3365486 RepID=UPI00371BC3A0
MAVTEGNPRRQPARESAARTYPRALPIVPVRARGLTVEGADGRRYLDCLSGAGTLALGHNHPVVLEVIRKVLDSGAPLNVFDLATPVEDAFVTELMRTLPPGLAAHARVQFCGPSATEAVETAVALVRAATGRPDIVAFTGTEHGMRPAPSVLPGESGGSPNTLVPAPADPSCPFGTADPDGTRVTADWTGTALSASPTVTRPAGILVEPVHGDCGAIPVPDAWLRATRRNTAAHSIPLIIDETQSGVGRTGAFWAVEHSGVQPDVMILSEAIGGSLPLAAVIHHADLAPRRPLAPSGPFRGNQLALAAGTATLAHVREQGLAARAAAVGSRMMSELRSLTGEFSCIRGVRGRGLMIGVELADDTEVAAARAVRKQAGAPRPGLAAAVQRECLRRGLIVGLAQRQPTVVRLLPPLTISDEQASAVLDRLADALTAACRAHPEERGRPSGRSERRTYAPHPDRTEHGDDGGRTDDAVRDGRTGTGRTDDAVRDGRTGTGRTGRTDDAVRDGRTGTGRTGRTGHAGHPDNARQADRAGHTERPR